jgi:serpin B
MKKSIFISLVALMGIGICSCSDEPNQGKLQPRQDITLTKSESDVNESAKTFAYSLIKSVDAYAAQKGQENWMVSPLSASHVLGMMANGAQGETLTELCDLLAIEPSQVADMNSYYKNLTEQLYKADNTSKLNIASALFVDDEFPIKTDFVTVCNDWYQAKAQNLDFDNPAAVKTVNQWFEKQTNGIIKNMLDPTYDKRYYVIANALYFNGTWPEPFSNWKKNRFYYKFPSTSQYKNGQTYIGKTGDFGYARIGDFEACEIPYGNGAFTMVIMLPIEKSLDECLANLTQESLGALLDDFDVQNLEVCMPDWEMSNEIKFDELLPNVGYKNILGPVTNYLSISDNQLWVKMNQKNYIKVDKKGTIIATVSFPKGLNGAPLPEKGYLFTANHPFLYLVRETSTGAILLIGKIGKL